MRDYDLSVLFRASSGDLPDESTPACLRSLSDTGAAAVSYEDALAGTEEPMPLSVCALLAALFGFAVLAAGLGVSWLLRRLAEALK